MKKNLPTTNSREPFKLEKEDTMSNNDPIKKKKVRPQKQEEAVMVKSAKKNQSKT